MKKFFLAFLMAAPMTMFAQKIGHVNVDAIVEGMSEYTELQTDVKTMQTQFQEELQHKQADINAKAEAFEKEQATLSETLRNYRQQEIQKAIDEYQQFGQTSEQELQRVYTTKMSAIQEKVMNAVRKVGEAEAFTYVLPASGIAFIGAGATDLTDKVKAEVGSK